MRTTPLAAVAAALLLAAPATAQSAMGAAQAGTAGHLGAVAAPTGDIVETAAAAGQFRTLLAAAKAAGLVETLRGEGPLTVFAPTDGAFAALPEGTVDALLRPENRERLRALLTYHVVPGQHTAEDVLGSLSLRTVQGASLRVHVDDGVPMVDDAHIVKTDIRASNGVIHVIDAVLMPPKSKASDTDG